MADLFAQGQSQNAGRHHRSKRPFGCLWWTSWFPGFSAPRQYGWKYSRSAIEPHKPAIVFVLVLVSFVIVIVLVIVIVIVALMQG